MHGQLVLYVGRRCQFLSIGLLESSHGVRDQRQQVRSQNFFYDLASEITYEHFWNILLFALISPTEGGRGQHECRNSRR